MGGVATRNGTNVRTHLAPWWLRAGLSTASAISPSLAARAGERLFRRPPRRPPSPRERAALAAGEPFVIATGGDRIRAWRFGEGPSVLLVHGWGGRGGQLAGLVPALTAAGCAVVTFDAPGHGASTGRRSSGVSFSAAVSAVAAHVGARAAVSHSMGGAALGWAVANGLALDAAVMLCPPRNVELFFRRFCDALGVSPALEQALRARIHADFTPDGFDLCRHVGPRSMPLLVVHDRDDGEVPLSHGEAIARAWPRASLSTTNGLGHRHILRDPAVADAIASFVREHLAACDCGRPAQTVDAAARPTCCRCVLERELFDPVARWA